MTNSWLASHNDVVQITVVRPMRLTIQVVKSKKNLNPRKDWGTSEISQLMWAPRVYPNPKENKPLASSFRPPTGEGNDSLEQRVPCIGRHATYNYTFYLPTLLPLGPPPAVVLLVLHLPCHLLPDACAIHSRGRAPAPPRTASPESDATLRTRVVTSRSTVL